MRTRAGRDGGAGQWQVRGRVTIAKDAETKAVEAAALADSSVQRLSGSEQ